MSERRRNIAVGLTDYGGRGIDTPEDYEEFVKRFAAN